MNCKPMTSDPSVVALAAGFPPLRSAHLISTVVKSAVTTTGTLGGTQLTYRCASGAKQEPLVPLAHSFWFVCRAKLILPMGGSPLILKRTPSNDEASAQFCT